MANSTISLESSYYTDVENYKFMVESPTTWTWQQALLFPALFVIPAEILALIVDGMIAYFSKQPGLPSPANLVTPSLCLLPRDLWISSCFRLVDTT